MLPIESMVLTQSGVATGILPVSPELAVFVLLAALVLSALGISFAVAPPSQLLHRLQPEPLRGRPQPSPLSAGSRSRTTSNFLEIPRGSGSIRRLKWLRWAF